MLDELYSHCTASIEKMSLENTLTQDVLLEFYGFFKQARSGDATDKDTPSMFDFKSKAKFDKWINNYGLTEGEAKRYYILKYASLSKECEEKAVKVRTSIIYTSRY